MSTDSRLLWVALAYHLRTRQAAVVVERILPRVPRPVRRLELLVDPVVVLVVSTALLHRQAELATPATMGVAVVPVVQAVVDRWVPPVLDLSTDLLTRLAVAEKAVTQRLITHTALSAAGAEERRLVTSLAVRKALLTEVLAEFVSEGRLKLQRLQEMVVVAVVAVPKVAVLQASRAVLVLPVLSKLVIQFKDEGIDMEKVKVSYEILDYQPDAEWIAVKFDRPGQEPWIEQFSFPDFSKEKLLDQFGAIACRLAGAWSRIPDHPKELSIPSKGNLEVDPELYMPYEPNIQPDPEPEWDQWTQDCLLGDITSPLQESIPWVVVDLTEEEIAERLAGAAQQARADRNFELAMTDGIVCAPDSTVEDKAPWLEYRQALRDVTSQPNFPKEIHWPTSPNYKG